MNISDLHRRVSVTSVFDPSAIAFFSATGITNEIQQQAVNYLVVSLKEKNLWDKMFAIYPMVGGTAFTHKWNLKDPRDLNEAYRLQFFGNVTHDLNGVKGDGISGNYDTFFTPNALNNSNAAFGVMIADNIASNGFDFASVMSSNSNVGILIISRGINTAADRFQFRIYSSGSINQHPNTDSKGLYILSRPNSASASDAVIYFKDSFLNPSDFSLSFSPAQSGKLHGMCRFNQDNSTKTSFSPRRQIFSFYSSGLTSNEVEILASIIKQYQTILGRTI